MSEYIGKAMNRLDGPLKVTGQARYASDWPEEKVAHAVVFESTVPAGKIRVMDLTAAKQVPGVIEIINYKNAPKLKKAKLGPGELTGENFLPFQDTSIYYNGQWIGVVVAETLEAAQQAARLVRVTYDESKAKISFDPAKWEKESYSYPKMEGMGKINSQRGNPIQGLKKSEVKIEPTYTIPIENHNPMEPSATFAIWKDGQLRVYDATQAVSSTANLLSQTVSVPKDKVQVITKFLGGGFGCKGSLWPHQIIAVMAAMKTKRPVKLTLTRQQMFTGCGHRARTIQKIAMGANHDGKLQAIQHTITNNTAVNKEYSERSGVQTGMMYSCENVVTDHRLVKMNYQVPTFMRAPGEASGSFALESAMDELAYALKIDPVELRKKNEPAKDEEKNLPFSSRSIVQCYDVAAKSFGWDRRNSQPGQVKDGEWYVGYGMAAATYPSHRFAATAKVELLDDGTAKVTSATQDLGTGTYTVMTQVAADHIGLDISKVHFDLGDSHFPKAGVSGGSTTVSSVGTAIKRAAEQLKEQMADMAVMDGAPLAGANPKELEFQKGRVFLKANPAKGESYADLLKRNGKKSMSALGGNPQQQKPDEYSAHAFGAHFVEVRVNSFTGEVRLKKWSSAFASAQIVNPKTALSQYRGGIIFGVGMALMEETAVDPRNGRPVTRDLADYHVPVQADIPPIDVAMVEEKDENVNPLGTKGIGEIGIVGVAAAIANAVFNATGVRIRDLPITPDKVLAGLQSKVSA